MDLEATIRTLIFTLRRLEVIKSFKQSSGKSYDMILKDHTSYCVENWGGKCGSKETSKWPVQQSR